jgi:predicted nicotinamide N-methyase
VSALRFRYQTIEFDGDVDIHLRCLRDNQQFSDLEGQARDLGISSAAWPMFGVLWPSGQVLAHFMQDYDIGGLRILEVGCGIGLTSLLLNKRGGDITATDHHPEAGPFLEENARINGGPPIAFVRTAWSDPMLDMGSFDLIVGSDVLYEADHVAELCGFINQHANATCTVIIVDPGRRLHARFSKRMVVEGFDHEQCKPPLPDGLEVAPGTRIITYQRSAPVPH